MHPLVTHINMGDTNGCIAYIDKLAVLGAHIAPDTMAISASAANYGNANYAVDDIRNGAGHVDDYTAAWWFGPRHEWFDPERRAAGEYSQAKAQRSSRNNVVFNLPHLTNEANVAGYLSWGAHSSLGSSYAVNKLPLDGKQRLVFDGDDRSFNGQRYQADFGN